MFGFNKKNNESFFEKIKIHKENKNAFSRKGVGSLSNIFFNTIEGINGNEVSIGGKKIISYGSFNYLGFSGDHVVSEAAKKAIDDYGTSVSASRLIGGETSLHLELEKALAEFIGVEDAVVFPNGFLTNETVIGHVVSDKDLIVSDSLCHASIQQGSKMSGATVIPFSHNKWEALEIILNEQRDKYKDVLIVLEGVYSMDGDIPYLPKFIGLKKKYNAMIMIDEAHSIGVIGQHGRGISEYCGVDPYDVDFLMGTISKSFGSSGGYIAGKKDVIDFLKFTVPGFVFSTGIPPSNVAAALAAIKILQKDPQRVTLLHDRIALFTTLAKKNNINIRRSKDSAVVPVITRGSKKAVQLHKMLHAEDIYALPILYPAVAENDARLRFFITCKHTEEQIHHTLNVLIKSIRSL